MPYIDLSTHSNAELLTLERRTASILSLGIKHDEPYISHTRLIHDLADQELTRRGITERLT